MNLKLDIDPHAVCRICLSEKTLANNLLNYFSNTVVEGYIIAIPDMVKNCLDIESDADDGLPDKICDVCKGEIINFHLFKEKSARTEQIILDTFGKPLRNKEPDPLETKPETATVGIQTMAVKSFQCLECKMIFKTESLLNKHINNRHSTMKLDAGSQTDDIGLIAEDNFIDEMIEPINIQAKYKQEMKMELLEVDDIELEEMEAMHVDTDDEITEHRSDSQGEYEIIEKIQEGYQCNDCLDIFPEVESFQSHKCPNKVIVHIVDEPSNALDSDNVSENYDEELQDVDRYECYRCHESFDHLEDFTSHRISKDCQQIDFPLKVVQSQRSKADDDYHCSLCHKRFKTNTTYNQHAKLHESIEVVIDCLDCSPCDDCHKIFLLRDKYVQHDCPRKKKNADGEYIDESCTDYQYLEQDTEFSCDECSMDFPNLTTARQHVVTHAKKFICPYDGCGCEYEIWSRFAMHLNAKHVNGKRFQCRFCEIECISFDALQAHYKNDCSEKKFKCSHCEKSYFSQKALNLHLKDITKGKTFKCSYCPKSFNRRGELDLHHRSHTNERPFKCTICGKAYKTSSMRAAHMDAHIEGKTFPCTMCDKKLQTRTSYRNHMKRHTEEKKHECQDCGKKFFTKFHVKLHASKIHAKGKSKPSKAPSNVIEIHYEDFVPALDDEQVLSSCE